MSHLRKEVLRQFKNLHRTVQHTFQGDSRAILLTRSQVNEHFQKNKNISDEGEIKKLLKLARDVEVELKTNVVQAVETEPGVFQVRVTEHTPLLDNVMFDENAKLEVRKGAKCCSEKEK
ncbi:unnamed protein product [Hermetia illucens]|uniref:Complex III assembly factor LYRM7 n=1 Tax=Hermetia illucens TaxID=343691 RepID=A0A7R8Z209_HERIL|nr:complex III assembly factor LYRM7 [Hermetia illucens]CAD7092508.1 unnamed protein product [Hermetia illucens]